MKLKLLLLTLLAVMSFSGYAQEEELTEKEKAYRDSIAAVNKESAATAESQEAYNAGVKYFEKGQFGQAISKFAEAIKIDPEFADAYYNKGKAEYEAAKYDDAVKTFTAYIGKESGGKGYFQRALAYQKLGKYAEAEGDYDKALSKLPKDEKVPYNYGVLKFTQKDYDGAIDMFSKAISIKSDFAYAYNDRGSCKRMLKKYEEAVADYEKAAKYNPNLPFVLNNIGSVKKKQGDMLAAIAAYNRALNIDEDYYLAYNNRGSVFVEQGKLDEAVRDFQRASSIKKDYAPAYNNLGAVYFKQEKYKEAVAQYNEAIKLDPKYANAYVNRGIAKEMLRDAQGACEDWAKARELGSEAGRVYQVSNCQ